jgi:broad specificity phosphatase PhoE
MIEIYLIRHGQASFGKPDYDCLSPVGEHQAELLGKHFAATGTRFDAVFAGALKRQIQTANLALRQMNGQMNDETKQDIVIDAGFNEFDDSDRIMNRLHAVVQADPQLSESMQDIHTQPGAIRRIFEVAAQTDTTAVDEARRQRQAKQSRERIGHAIDHLVQRVKDNQKVAVFTSGGPTAVALLKTLETSREQTLRLGWELRNTSVTVLRYHEERLGLVLFNSVAHLESQNDPALITYI